MLLSSFYVPNIGAAQTRFQWPDSRFDFTKYKHIEACAGVEQRVRDSINSYEYTYYDTLHPSVYNKMMPLANPIVSAVQQCLKPFSVEQVPLNMMGLILPLYLVANEDEAAKRLQMRAIEAVPKDSTARLITVIDSGIQYYRTARPIRTAGMLDMYSRIEALGSKVSTLQRLDMVGMLSATGVLVRDTAFHKMVFEKLIAVARSLTEEEWNTALGMRASVYVFMHLKSIYKQDLEHALAISTDEYKKKAHSIFTTLIGRAPLESDWTKDDDVGRVAPPVAGDFWFPKDTGKRTFPRRGVVTVVMGIDAKQEQQMRTAAVARRLIKANPDVDVVLVAQTGGWFRVLQPPPPEQEAVLIDSLIRKLHRVDAIVGVTNTEFWRLPGNDRRRINNITMNEENGYSLQTYLIDKEGRIVTYGGIQFIEELYEKLIPILNKRDTAKQP